MLIEAYGAEGAIALSEKYSFDFLKSLITQTAEMRKSEEDRENEDLEEQQEEFFSKNQNKSVILNKENGETEKVNLSQFTLSNEQLLGNF